jgi:hypothetical protein
LCKRVKLTHALKASLTIKVYRLIVCHIDTKCIRINQYHLYSILQIFSSGVPPNTYGQSVVLSRLTNFLYDTIRTETVFGYR